MGRTNHHPLIDLERDREELPPGFLFQDIVICLNAAEIVLAHGGPALFEAPGPWTERDTVVTNLSLRPEILEGLPDRRVPDRGGIRVVQLEDIDVGRRKPIQSLLQRSAD